MSEGFHEMNDTLRCMNEKIFPTPKFFNSFFKLKKTNSLRKYPDLIGMRIEKR